MTQCFPGVIRGRAQRAGMCGVAVAFIVIGPIAAVRLSGTPPEGHALLAGWALAALNAVGMRALNRWALSGPPALFLRRAIVSWGVRLPALLAGLLALLLITDLQRRSLLAGFFAGYFACMIIEVSFLHKTTGHV